MKIDLPWTESLSGEKKKGNQNKDPRFGILDNGETR